MDRGALRTLRSKPHPGGLADIHTCTASDPEIPLDGLDTAVQSSQAGHLSRSAVPTINGVRTNTKNTTPLEPSHYVAQDSNI